MSFSIGYSHEKITWMGAKLMALVFIDLRHFELFDRIPQVLWNTFYQRKNIFVNINSYRWIKSIVFERKRKLSPSSIRIWYEKYLKKKSTMGVAMVISARFGASKFCFCRFFSFIFIS